MAKSKGKEFEEQFKRDWLGTFPNSVCYRLPDQQSRYKHSSKNPCDFFCFEYTIGKLCLVEVKSHLGNTLPFSCIKQYDELLKYIDTPGVIAGVVAWFIDHDKVLWISIEEMEKMKKDNKKSINIKMLEESLYNIVDVPSIKKRTYLSSDYSFFKEM